LHRIGIEEQPSPRTNENIKKGDIVSIKDGHEIGEVIDIQGIYGVVVCGTTKLRISLGDLQKAKTQKLQKLVTTATISATNVKNEIDLRGLAGDEAISLVQNFLDNAYAAGLHRVDIIHGKGSGALRKRINEFVKTYPHVKSFKLGEWNEGGAGVTVVELT
jgi:DNA mismatch repair protein MutS2